MFYNSSTLIKIWYQKTWGFSPYNHRKKKVLEHHKEGGDGNRIAKKILRKMNTWITTPLCMIPKTIKQQTTQKKEEGNKLWVAHKQRKKVKQWYI